MSELYRSFLKRDAFNAKLASDRLRKDAEEIFKKADPTNNRKFTRWILTTYEEGYNHKLEDVKVWMYQSLSRFISLVDRKKLAVEYRDITTIPGLFGNGEKPGLIEILKKYYPEEALRIVDPEIVYTNPYVTIYVIKNKTEAIFVGQGTRWCTSVESDNNPFDWYINQGPIYYINFGGAKYQMHIPTLQFMDHEDNAYGANNEVLNNVVIEFLASRNLIQGMALLKCLECSEKQREYDIFAKAAIEQLERHESHFGNILQEFYKTNKQNKWGRWMYPRHHMQLFIDNGVKGIDLFKRFGPPKTYKQFKIMFSNYDEEEEDEDNSLYINSFNFKGFTFASNECYRDLIDYADDKFILPCYLLKASDLNMNQILRIRRYIGTEACISYLMNNGSERDKFKHADLDYRMRLARCFPQIPFVMFMLTEEIEKADIEFAQYFVSESFFYYYNWSDACLANGTESMFDRKAIAYYHAYTLYYYINKEYSDRVIFNVNNGYLPGAFKILAESNQTNLLEAGFSREFIEAQIKSDEEFLAGSD